MSEQGSPEWMAERRGRVTASRVADVVARTKTGWGASRSNYMAELIAERLTNVSTEHYQNAAMQWGTDTEPHARAAYSFYADADVVEVGFIEHPAIRQSGASPDGLIGEDGLLELKCPNTATHIDTLLGEAIPDKYIKQMQFQMACTGRKWCDFVSYDPRLPGSMQLFVQRVKRDDVLIAELERQIVEFLREIDGKVAALRQRFEKVAA